MPDGRRLVHGTREEKMVAVDIMAQDGNLMIGPPVPFFGGQPAPDRWSIAPDGRRILAAVTIEEGPTAPRVLVTDWARSLERP